MIVKNYMIKNINSVCDSDTIGYAIKLMQKSKMSVLPVVDEENNFMGSLYSSNLLKNILPEEYGYIESEILLYEVNQAANNLKEIKDKLVTDYMSKKSIAINDTDSMDHIAEVMLTNEESFLFVTNEAGKLRGYLTRAGLLYYLLKVGE